MRDINKFKNLIKKEASKINECACENPSLNEQDDINEMARIATLYDVDDSEENLTKLPEKVRNGKTLKGIIDHIKEKGPSAVAVIAKEKFDKPQQSINGIIKILTDAGVLVSQGLEKEPEYLKPKEPGKLGRPSKPKEPDATVDISIDGNDNEPDLPQTDNFMDDEVSMDDVEPDVTTIKKSSLSTEEDELASLEKEMKDKAREWKAAKGDDKERLKGELKALTAKKKDLEKKFEDDEESLDENELMLESYNRWQKLANIKRLI